MTVHPSSVQFRAPAARLRRHDPEDQTFQCLPAPLDVIRAVGPAQLVTHAFPCRKGLAFALVALQYDPRYRIFPIALQDRTGLHSFSGAWGVVETDNPILPHALIPEVAPRNIAEAIRAVQDWLRVAIDGDAVKARVW